VARATRTDAPGYWYHVMNRGLARRTLFETRRDSRMFLSRIAGEVRAARIEVHAYCIMTTHFHLLVRSTCGELSNVMQRAQNDYARWFNRARKRDGPLFRGRFSSRRVRSHDYRKNLVRYIDFNPVQAGLVTAPTLYPYGSAYWYARHEGPPWLHRDWVEERVRLSQAVEQYDPDHYAQVFGKPISSALTRLVERRLLSVRDVEDSLEDLLVGSSPQVIEWMRRKACVADGTDVGMPVCDAEMVSSVIEEQRRSRGDWWDPESQRPIDAWPQVHAALLRDLCAMPRSEIGLRTKQSERAVDRARVRHRRSVVECPQYAFQVAQLAIAALDRCHGPHA
jgi:REP element-mobilizing transposase RayT